MDIKRTETDPPLAIREWGWRFHHMGIPTSGPIKNERYLPHLKFYVGGFESSPFGIEWMRFEEDCPVNQLAQTFPHIAFEVDDLDLELQKHNFKIITKPNAPGEGVRVAMLEHNGAPVELIEFN